MSQYHDLNHFHWTLRPAREKRRRRIAIFWCLVAANAILLVVAITIVLTMVSL